MRKLLADGNQDITFSKDLDGSQIFIKNTALSKTHNIFLDCNPNEFLPITYSYVNWFGNPDIGIMSEFQGDTIFVNSELNWAGIWSKYTIWHFKIK